MKFFDITCQCTRCGNEIETRVVNPRNSCTIVCTICGVEITKIRARECSGFIYILANPRIIDLYKIGYTEGDPISRAIDISKATGVPDPYEVIAYYPSASPFDDEMLIHDKLKSDRPNSAREFFDAPLSYILDVCQDITGFPIAYKHPHLSENCNIALFDFWASIRSKHHVVQAEKSGNNFICVRCGNLMRPPKSSFRERGVFRWCKSCGFYVDTNGKEVILRPSDA